jgi:hypothetical protein
MPGHAISRPGRVPFHQQLNYSKGKEIAAAKLRQMVVFLAMTNHQCLVRSFQCRERCHRAPVVVFVYSTAHQYQLVLATVTTATKRLHAYMILRKISKTHFNIADNVHQTSTTQENSREHLKSAYKGSAGQIIYLYCGHDISLGHTAALECGSTKDFQLVHMHIPSKRPPLFDTITPQIQLTYTSPRRHLRCVACGPRRGIFR